MSSKSDILVINLDRTTKYIFHTVAEATNKLQSILNEYEEHGFSLTRSEKLLCTSDPKKNYHNIYSGIAHALDRSRHIFACYYCVRMPKDETETLSSCTRNLLKLCQSDMEYAEQRTFYVINTKTEIGIEFLSADEISQFFGVSIIEVYSKLLGFCGPLAINQFTIEYLIEDDAESDGEKAFA